MEVRHIAYSELVTEFEKYGITELAYALPYVMGRCKGVDDYVYAMLQKAYADGFISW